MFSRNARIPGWGAVALVLLYDGITHSLTGTVWPRIKGDGMLPVAEGWPVIALGLIEAAAGVYLGFRLLSRR